MSEVLDYSWARPGGQRIREAGYIGAVRYLSGGNSKDLGIAERDDLLSHGVEIGLVWETTASMMNGGYAAGHNHGIAATQEADALGFPRDRPIYFANDQNACTNTHVDYMRGARDASPRSVGPYGNSELINRCAGELACRYGWKVSTWGPSSDNACLVQEANWPATIAGTDRNSVHRDDWGQWHGKGEEDVTSEEHGWLRNSSLILLQLQEHLTSQYAQDVRASTLEAAQTTATQGNKIIEVLEEIKNKLP